MKFNQKELACYASAKSGKADKEGFLYMKESEKKKEAYSQRWFTLSGNLLFYTKEDSKDSPPVGVVVLEQCKIESEAHSGNRNAFRLLFQDTDAGYWFFANSAREADEWIKILNCASYEYLRGQFSELRGQLVHLTGKDPISEGGPLRDWPVNAMPLLAIPAPGYDGEPVFELCIACSSLVGAVSQADQPSTLIITHCMTPPQAYWIRYAQTEVIEKSSDPLFLTPVVFFEGKIFSTSRLRFDVFDVFDKNENLMRPVGQVQCEVKDLVSEINKTVKFDILFDDKIAGYLLLTARMSGQRSLVTEGHTQPITNQTKMRSAEDTPPIPHSFRSPLDNISVRRFQFPLCDDSEHHINVTEIMGECIFSFSIPIQMLEMCIAEDNTTISQFKSLEGLSENWEIIRQEVVMDLNGLVEHYQKNRETLQHTSESGKLFKKSVDKDNSQQEFVPVNLHIQEMKQARSSESKERVVYSCTTVGCPSAYSLKYKHGGLARLQASVPRLSMGGTFSPGTENKSSRVKQLLKRISNEQAAIKTKASDLLIAAKEEDKKGLKSAVNDLVEKVAWFENRCKIMLLQDALKDWYNALNPSKLPSFITSLTDLTPTSVLSSIEEHIVCVEAQVDGVITGGLSSEEAVGRLQGPIKDFTRTLDSTIDIFHSSLFFVLLKEHHHLQLNKAPVGLKGFKHRRDIVFSHTVTSVVTCFVMKLLRSISSKHFLTQLQELGFLVHWESLLSTHSDENGMLEDFIVAIHDINSLKFKLIQANSFSDVPRVQGSRYKVVVDIPVQAPMYKILPSGLQNGKEIGVVAVLFTQGINEQQSLADTFGDSHLQEQINFKNFHKLATYCEKYRERFSTAGLPLAQRTKEAMDLLHQLKGQVQSRKAKNTDILTLSQSLCRLLDCGRLTSCKSAKDRTAMSVTLEQAHILLNWNMDPIFFQQALDTMRSSGTRIRNCEKNVGTPLYAFNALQVVTLPKNYRPPEGTYKKLQT